jgi:O-antigen/teichoic acid export membrane protein
VSVPEEPPEEAPKPLLSQLLTLGRHSAIYGLGGLMSRFLAVFLIPLYTHYLTTSSYGKIETVTAAAAVMTVLLQAGVQNAFFRFYFDSEDPAYRRRLLRTAFWFIMTTSTTGLVLCEVFASPLSGALNGVGPNIVRVGGVLLWSQVNYAQLTNLFRVEQRSVAFTIASLANIGLTIPITVVLVVVFRLGPEGVIVGNFSGTLLVYVALLGYRREQLGLQFDRALLRRMNKFGWPLVPSALATWVANFGDRFMVGRLATGDVHERLGQVGQYSLAIKVGSVMVLLFTAFQVAWPAFAYAIKSEQEAKRTYSFVLTYLVLLASWAAVALGVFSPWIVRVLAPTRPSFWPAARAVAPLAFSSVCWAGFIVVTIAVARTRKTQFNWIASGAGAALNVGLNFWLIPAYGMLGAAWATLAAYALMLVVRTWNAQLLYKVPYQWRRVTLVVGVAAALTAADQLLPRSIALAFTFTLAYPLVLAAFGFYLPVERARLKRLLPVRAP